MAILHTAIDGERVVTPKVITNSLKTGDTEITHFSTTIIDEEDGVPLGCALQPWIDSINLQITNRLDEFEELMIGTYEHPATHSAAMITETAARVWFTPDERTKLLGVTPEANKYEHPLTHSADEVDPTTERLWFTPVERSKLTEVAPEANFYEHPLKHQPNEIDGLLGTDGNLNSDLIKELEVHRINVRQTLLSGFRWDYAGEVVTDYTNAPLLEMNVNLGSDQYIFRITPGLTYSMVATMANGFDANIGNVDTVVTITSPITTPPLSSYGFAPNTQVWVVLRADKTLYVTSTPQYFDPVTMTNSVPNELPIIRAKVSAANNYFTNIVVLQANRYISHRTGYIPFGLSSFTIKNRFLSFDVMVQVLRMIRGETVWTVVDNYNPGSGNYNVGVTVSEDAITLVTTDYITSGMTEARFSINVFRPW